ncbi:MAG: polyprenol monophosphomannose synthase [Planctomycetota bacterium]
MSAQPSPAKHAAAGAGAVGRIVVTVPTYNEIENIVSLCRAILGQDGRIEVLVVDDNSPDGTWRAVAELAATEPRVRLLHRTTDRGRGRAGRAGFLAALERQADLVFEMDADWSHHPEHLPAMIAALGAHDVVLGSRQVPGGADIGRPPARIWLTHASNLYVRLVLGLPVRDCNSGYRGFRASALRAIEVESAFSPGPALVHELLYKAKVRRLRLTEVPIQFRERERGTSTLTFATLLRSYTTILRLRWLGLTGRLFARAA